MRENFTDAAFPGWSAMRWQRSSEAGPRATSSVRIIALLEPLRALADAVHAEGGAISGQLAHCGGFSRAKPVAQRRPLGPSAGINAYGLPVGVPFCGAMREADIERTVADYAGAARMLRRAGFDALELHMGHGYLLSQFISPATNRRSDAYGGSIVNRMRFPLQVLAAVREAVGSSVPLLAKINLADGFAGGLEPADAAQVARLLQAGGIDAIVMSGGFVSRTPMVLFRGDSPLQAMIAAEPSAPMRWAMRLGGKHSFPALPFEPLYFLEQAQRVRDAVTVPLAYLGGVTSGEDVERLVRAGFELVCVGRALLHDPQFVNRLRDEPAHRSACTHCNLCVATLATPQGTRCMLPGRD